MVQAASHSSDTVSTLKIRGKRNAPEDFISNMPDSVVTNILDRLPLQNVVGTSVLSRNWRFKWTMLSQLVFDRKFFDYLSRTKGKNNHLRIISRILLHLRGAITKFVLFKDNRVLDDEDVNHWILFLSRKGIKDLTLQSRIKELLLSPTHLFSCLELKHLKLYNCRFHPPPSFHGFPYLLSLELCGFGNSDEDFEGSSDEDFEFLTRCPLLESLHLSGLVSPTNVKLVATAKLENLKMLSLTMSDFIFEVVGSLPKLQELTLDFLYCELTDGGAKKTFPTTFPSLKVLELSLIDLDYGIMISCAFELIWSFPNLQTFEITSKYSDYPVCAVCSHEVDYNTMGPLPLRNVDFTIWCYASENEIYLMKYLLARSPYLKKFVIRFDDGVEPEEKLMFARKVLKLQRAYPAVDIDLC